MTEQSYKKTFSYIKPSYIYIKKPKKLHSKIVLNVWDNCPQHWGHSSQTFRIFIPNIGDNFSFYNLPSIFKGFTVLYSGLY